ncbi:MAG: hypothetical protein KDK30_16785 [Leptospiraceae bacterium]|nr:hypothetical protein [Leptospiraceae bacterium]MCB1315987.1 hypothetical protein [Leptospiraceae bacterium]
MYSEIGDLTPGQFHRFAQFIYARSNINLKEQKITLLSNRLRKRLMALNLKSFDEYFDLISGPGGKQELVHFLEVVTTNETYFWRTTANFTMLREEILPDLLRRFPGQKLQFWSAGCSTGEEPYNIAIELVEGMKRTGVFDFQIVATDLSARVLDFAREARYAGRKIDKIPEPVLRRYFRPDTEKAGYYRVRDDIRERVEFRLENLFETNRSGLHCIICRNVMIYFRREDQEVLVNRFYRALRPGGYLIVGHSESLHMLKTQFKPRNMKNGVSYFRDPDAIHQSVSPRDA